MSMNIQCNNSELIKQAMMVVTIIASALIYNDYGLCLKQMKLVRRKNSVIENGKANSHKTYVYNRYNIYIDYVT